MNFNNVEPPKPQLHKLLDLYKKRKFDAAEKLSISITQQYPNHSFSWKILAIIFEQTNRTSEALVIHQKLATLSPKDPEVYLGIGNSLRGLGRLNDAILNYNKAINLNQKFIKAHYHLAQTLKQLGRYKDAIIIFEKILSLDSNIAEVHFNLGLTLKELGKIDKALIYFNQAINLKPNFFLAFYSLGNAQKEQGKIDEAVKNYKKAIALKKDFAEAYNNLGLVLIDLGRIEDALHNINQAISLKPKYPQAFYNLGIIYKDIGKFDEAEKNYKKAIALKPDYAEAFNNLGVIFYDTDRLQEALFNINQAISLKPKYPQAYFGLGNTLKDLRRLKESFNNYEKAITLKPDYAEAFHNWGRALLLDQNFEMANKLMEWRWQTDQNIGNSFNSIRPKWNGVNNQKILIWREQGIGDEIMFSSSIFELKFKSEKVLVECDHRLTSLFQRSFPHDVKLVSDKTKVSVNDYDSHLPIGSLPLHYRNSLNSFKKTSMGWLKADPTKIEKFKKEINKNLNEKIIGISWYSASTLDKANNRNIKLTKLIEPLKKFDVKFVNLQYGSVSDEISKLRLEHNVDILEIPYLDKYNDLDGLAALISACDFVISIDNITPHLAGALGVSTKLLLPYIADERWGLDPHSSYLYDSVKFYRQSDKKDWNWPMEKLANDLKKNLLEIN